MIRAELGVDGTSMRYGERARKLAAMRAAAAKGDPGSESGEDEDKVADKVEDEDEEDTRLESEKHEAEMRAQAVKITEEAMEVLRAMAGW